MEEVMPAVFGELMKVRDALETHYRDMQDIEFTVQQGKLYMLQTRTGKRTAQAALKIAADLADSGVIGKRESGAAAGRSFLARSALASQTRSESDKDNPGQRLACLARRGFG